MDQATIGALLCATIFLLALGIASERAIAFRAKALEAERLRIGLKGEVERGKDAMARLQSLLEDKDREAAMLTIKLDRANLRHDLRTKLIAEMTDELTEARGKLAKFAPRKRDAKGHFVADAAAPTPISMEV